MRNSIPPSVADKNPKRKTKDQDCINHQIEHGNALFGRCCARHRSYRLRKTMTPPNASYFDSKLRIMRCKLQIMTPLVQNPSGDAQLLSSLSFR
jgi:hypothetical protein